MKTINSFRSKLLALTLALMASVASFAYEFEYVNDFHIDGFAYKILPSNTMYPYGSAALVEIADCTKDVVIPEFVSNGNSEFRIETFGIGSVVFTNEASSIVESITIPKTIKIINKNVLAGCPNLKTVIVDSENPYYDSRESCNAIITTSQNRYFTPNTLIAGCKATTIPNSVVEIGENAFYNCQSLETITIPNSITKIGISAFNACTALSAITLSENLTAIGEWAFDDCNNLIEVVCYATQPPTISRYTFLGISPTIYVPVESIELYRKTNIWKDFQIMRIAWSEECYEYRDYNLTTQLFPRKSSLVYLLYNTIDRTIEPPYVDSVWILDPELDKQNPLHVHTSYAQPGDTIDLSFLEKNKHYILKVHINECQMSRVFLHRVVKWEYKWCNQWNVMWFDGWRFDETAKTSHYQLGQDTVIGDYTYRKFTSRTSVRFTEDWKVYVYYEGFDDNDPYTPDLPTGEYLAYDFSAKVGDTLEVFSGIGTYSTYPCVVDDVQIDSETNLRTMTLHKICRIDTDGDGIEEDYDDREMTWIEGVGSPEGFLISDLPCGWVGGGTNHLLCAYKDDELKYTGTLYDEYGCEYNAGQEMEDLFPTLWGLQRTSFTEYFDSGHQPESAPYLLKAGDTKWIGGKLYLDFGQYLREENGKIYIYSELQKKDFVLYDFTLELGDTLTTLNWDYYNPNSDGSPSVVDYDIDDCQIDTLIVTGISTITLLDGKKYKKWIFNHGHFGYVESIGTLSGSFYAISEYCMAVPGCYMGNHLVCASRNGQLLYKMDDAKMEQLETECLCEIEPKWSETWCNQWNILSHGYLGPQDPLAGARTSIYWLSNNTVNRNGQEYIPLMCSSSLPNEESTLLVGELRFTEDKQVYFYYAFDETEYLLYDFGADLGDTLELFAGLEFYDYHKTYTHVITDKETLDDGRLQIQADVVIRIDNGAGEYFEEKHPVTWIEGLGSTYGIIFNPSNPGVAGDGAIIMLCAYRDDECVYTTNFSDYKNMGCVYNNDGTVDEDLFPMLAGLQRTVCNEFCGDTEDDNSSNTTYKQTFDKILFERDQPYIYCNSAFLLREENNKILIYSHSLDKDLVLYDFTLEVGDSLPQLYLDEEAKKDIYWIYYEYMNVVDYNKYNDSIYPADTLIVTDVSMITLLDGKEYKKWTFNNGMEYVEGIGMYGGSRNGNFFGLIREVVVPCHTGTHLVCVSKNNKLLYQMDPVKMDELGAECLCNYDRGPRKDNAKDGQIGGRPTPTQWNQLELDLREMDNGTTILRAETFSYTLENDSVVANDKIFYQLARQSTKDTATTKSFVGALHFGKDEDNRVYFLRDGVEYVLYDFTAEPGDTVEIFAGINNYPQDTTYTHVVTGKDTLENGACRMLLEVVFPDETTAENAEKVWLAGLGSTDGIVHNTATRTSNAHAAPARSANSETQTSVMLCAWREDSCLYTTNHPEYDTFGCVYNQDPTAVEDISTSQSSYQKIIREGQFLILHNGKTYSVMGIEL